MPSTVTLCDGTHSQRIPVPIQTMRLELRPFMTDDIEPHAALMADPQVTRFIGGPRPREVTVDSVGNMQRAFEARGWGTLAVLTRSTRDYIGYCGVRPLTNTVDVEVAFAIKTSTWGNGFATEALVPQLTMHLSTCRFGVSWQRSIVRTRLVFAS